jgi:hypothetical protein
VIRCHKRDMPLSLELAEDLPVQSFLVGFHRSGFPARPPGADTRPGYEPRAAYGHRGSPAEN